MKHNTETSLPFGIECEFSSRRSGHERRSHLSARYEVDSSSMSDDYLPTEISARRLLEMWAEDARRSYPGGIVSISWYVDGSGGVFESLPGVRLWSDKDFRTYYTHPMRCDTGEQLQWIHLPVADLGWNAQQSDKGGFIQEATGWKPSIFQPFVQVDHLLGFSSSDQVRGTDGVAEFVKSQHKSRLQAEPVG